MRNSRGQLPSRKAREIFGLVQRQETVSKQLLQEQSGLTMSTLTRTLEELNEIGLLTEVGYGESTGGRRPILYRTNPEYAYLFGLDISRMRTRLILFNMQLKRLEQRVWLMTENTTPDYLLRQVAEAAAAMLRRREIPRDKVLGIGVGAVGPLDRREGRILEPLHFPASGWKDVAICAYFEENLGIPAILDNGANAAILGEYWANRMEDYQHLLYVHAAVGLRSAMMSNGKVVYGAVDMEGAIGQMIIQSDGPPSRSIGGNHGALETYVSIYALEKEAKSRLRQGRRSILTEWLRDPEQLTFHDLVKALKEDDPLVTEIFTQSATYFGIGLANLLNILHPEKVILGGSLITEHDLFFQVATEVALRKTYYSPVYQVTFSKGSLGEEAVATGAACLVMNHWIEA
jgi:predicted NBD/HSP70 family sugar kinase